MPQPTNHHLDRRITLSINNPEAEDQDLLSLDIFPDMTLETLRSSIQAETRIEPNAQHLYHNGQLITDDSKTMEQLQIGDGEMLALHVRDMRGNTGVPVERAQQRRPPPEQDPELVRLNIIGNPAARAEVQRTQPRIAETLDDPVRFAAAYRDAFDRERRERAERQRAIQALNADPFDVDAQARIEEIIRQERVMENLQNAMEHNPEVFGRVHLLYIDVEVNGHKVKALVDSGAQATIMSPATAEACNIMRLVDKRFAGVAKGVGTATIVGRVHSAQIRIGSLFLPCSFTVMEGKNVELLLGLDMLKRHQACIDLTRDKLVIQGVEVSFLGEADIPKETEEALGDEPTVSGPGGTTIGGRTGAVHQAGAEASGTPGPSSSAQPAAPSAPVATPAAPAQPQFSDEAIGQLMQLGFSREAAVRALEATGGNVEYAAGLLFQG
ncbi:DNA damage-inducible protein 1 [Cytospora mali]|uniref:DNA damage-inducible protein 1 n=1 Tax=Cytospora mali TaxID=578113 RepID=A0A194VVI0_CYTMA|nr:DNA damage-inducible protein 1 [Valsa mali]